MITKNPETATQDLAALLTFARASGGIVENENGSEFDALARLILECTAKGRAAEMRDLIRLTQLAQEHIELPVYTLRMAAAWLGLSYEAVRDAVYANRLDAIKPGHDLLLLHPAVAGYREKMRYSINRWVQVLKT